MDRSTLLSLFIVVAVALFPQVAGAQDARPSAGNLSRYVYIPNSDVISIYSLNSKGQLRADGFQPGDPQFPYTSSVIDPMGRFFFAMAGDFGCNTISVFSIAPATGLLTPVPGSPFQTPTATFEQAGVIAVTPNGKFVYTAGNEDGGFCGHSNISGFSIDPATGALTPIPGSPFNDGARPNRIVVDPQGKFLFAADNANPISVFSIDPNTGALTAVAGSPFSICGPPCLPAFPVVAKNGILYVLLNTMNLAAFNVNPTTGFLTQLIGSPFPPAGAFPTGLAADPAGRFLYVSDGSLNDVVWVYAIDQQTGVPKLVPSSPFTVPHGPLTVNTDPKGKFLYAPSLGSYYTAMFKIQPTGTLSLVGNIRGPVATWASWFTTGTTAVSYLPKFAYVANSGANSISEYSINPDGTLFELPGSPFADSNGPTSVAPTPAGTFVYALDANHKVSGYSVTAPGTLTAVSGSPFSGFTSPTAVVTDPSNTYVFVVDAGTSPGTGRIWMEKIAANGSLTFANQAINGSNTPVAATMGPGSEYLLVLNSVEKVIATYEPYYRSPASLSSVLGTAATGNGPSALAVDPSNNYVYVTNSGDGTVSAYKISDGNDGHNQGTPFAIAGSPFAAGTSPSAVVAEPSGKYLYVANTGNSNIFAYKINPKTGKLTRITGAFATGSAPDSLAVSNDGKYLYASNKSSGSVSVFKIGTTGTLTAETAAATGTSPTAIATTGTRQ